MAQLRLRKAGMPELTPQERLQPALLDRLTDEEPERTQEARGKRVMAKSRVRQARPARPPIPMHVHKRNAAPRAAMVEFEPRILPATLEVRAILEASAL